MSARRQPKQLRSRQTVEVILQAVIRVLKREGVDAVTTNRIAEVAGVSIGSVYQYFPDKRAIYLALHERHAEEMGLLVERTVMEHASGSLEHFFTALVDALIDAHSSDPELFSLLDAEVPHRSAGAHAFELRLRNALRLVLRAHDEEHTLERMTFDGCCARTSKVMRSSACSSSSAICSTR
jgi:AcrR family transcriptional regulator